MVSSLTDFPREGPLTKQLMTTFAWHFLVNLKKKNAQHENCKLSFIRGKMNTAVWEIALQIAEKLFQRAGRGEGQYICDFSEEGLHAIKQIFFQKVSTSLVKFC